MQQVSAKTIVWAITLAAASAAMPAFAQEITRFSSLADQGRASVKPLSQEQAFPYLVSMAGEKGLKVTWQPAAEHYLYKRAFKFTYHPSEDATALVLPFKLKDGLAKNDEFFGAVEVYYDQVDITLDLPQTPSANGFVVIEYQGCADWGFCYPPQSESFRF